MKIDEGISNFQYSALDQENLKPFWAIASQFRANSLGDVLHTLKVRDNLTVRNVMTYRYLGLLKKSGDSIVRTPAGEHLVSSPPEDQQRILDMQIAKIWLSNPTNPRMRVDVYPFEILTSILISAGRVSWDEYLTVVMWIQDISEVPMALELLSEYRKLTASAQQRILHETEKRSGSQDLGNQARRLHRAMAAHSIFLRNADSSLELSVSDSAAQSYLDAFVLARAEGESDYGAFLEQVSEFAPSDEALEPLILVLGYRDVFLDSPKEVPQSGNVKRSPRKIDHVAKAKNQALSGLRAEVYVLESERAILEAAGRKDLSEKVEQVSLLDDGAGFDILSFSSEGKEKHIEVKSVGAAQGVASVFISRNEVLKAKSDDLWELVVVVGNGTTKPFLWKADVLRQAILDTTFGAVLQGPDLSINATQFQITFRMIPTLEAD